MPNSLQAKKRLRQNVVRRDRNRAIRSAMRKLIKNVRVSAAAGEVEAAKEAFQQACQSLDRAAARNIIHANKAARTKSRLSAAIKKASAEG